MKDHIKIAFSSAIATSLKAGEKALQELEIFYEKQPDGTLLVRGNIGLGAAGISHLPDFSRVIVLGGFGCFDNKLTTLEGAPLAVGGIFECDHNPLTSLEGVPQNFSALISDFGAFNSWADVPQHLRLSPETKARQTQEFEEMIRRSATLQRNLPLPKLFRKQAS